MSTVFNASSGGRSAIRVFESVGVGEEVVRNKVLTLVGIWLKD